MTEDELRQESVPETFTSGKRAMGPDRELLELAQAYKLLKYAHDTMAELSCKGSPEFLWSARDENSREARLSPLADRLYEMAWEIAAIEASTVAGACAKGEVLLDWCEDLNENVKDGLAVSLCADLRRIALAARTLEENS